MLVSRPLQLSRDLFQTAGLKREDVFLTTKLWPGDYDNPKAAFHRSLQKLGVDYIDLYLVHWPDCDAGANNPHERLRIWRFACIQYFMCSSARVWYSPPLPYHQYKVVPGKEPAPHTKCTWDSCLLFFGPRRSHPGSLGPIC
jgi:hypothetical protein